MSSLVIPLQIKELKNIADKFGTPAYCYSEHTIRERCRALAGLFPDLPVKWLYAMKANDNPFLLDIVKEEGFGFDTVSIEEVELARRFVEDANNIFYTESNMSDAEMEYAVKSGVRLNIGSFSRLKSFCEHPESKSCSIRIKPDIGDGLHQRVTTGNRDSKFGIRLDILDECLRIAKDSGVKITGIHVHIGSGIREPRNLLAAMERMAELATLFPDLERINFGGGLPVPYRDEDEAFSLDEFKRIAHPLLQQLNDRYEGRIDYFFEPGRYIMAPAGVLLSQVTSVKDQGNVTYIGTDTGFNHLARPILYHAYHRVLNISRIDDPETTEYSISGNICESTDILARDRMLPEAHEGDLLAFADAGAYGMTMASEYNRRRYPAEVLIKSDGSQQCIRPRLDPEQAIDQFLRSTGYEGRRK